MLYEDRIAYVGNKRPETDAYTMEINAAGFTLVPGYVEPHAHPWQLANVQSFSEFALSRGTTTMINDNLVYYLNLGEDQYERLMDYCSSLPIKNFWWARLDPQSTQPDMLAKFTTERLVSEICQDRVLQAGELTSWPLLLSGDETMLLGITAARNLGKRIEGHNPGASADTLNTMAALGVTACHEAIQADEVLKRLRVGMYATLRHSSIRPDLPHLVSGLLEKGFDFNAASRLMMTTDGSMPPFHKNGFVDYLIQLALEHGVPVTAAYRMATLNPAVYYGLDQELGAIAPGRLADILFLKDLNEPKPEKVMAEGKLVAEKGNMLIEWPACEWEQLHLVPMDKSWRLKPDSLELKVDLPEIPILELVNAVIVKRRDVHLPIEDGRIEIDRESDLCYVSLIDQNGQWVTTGIIKGFANRALYSITFGPFSVMMSPV